MVKPNEADIKFEAEARQKRMEEIATRIGRTDGGERFLMRIYEIGKPKPLREEPEEGE